MSLDDALERVNSGMIAFDLALGTGTLLAPRTTAKVVFGHDVPSRDAEYWIRRCGPIWLTFAAAHLVAARRGEERDWWALAWLRATELFTDVLLSGSPAIRRPTARAGLWGAGVGNLLMTAGFARLAQRRARSRSSLAPTS